MSNVDVDYNDFKLRKMSEQEARGVFLPMIRLTSNGEEPGGAGEAWLSAMQAYFKTATRSVHYYYHSGSMLFQINNIHYIDDKGEATYTAQSLAEHAGPYPQLFARADFFKDELPNQGVYTELTTNYQFGLPTPLLSYRSLLTEEHTELTLFLTEESSVKAYVNDCQAIPDGGYVKVTLEDELTHRSWDLHFPLLFPELTPEFLTVLLLRNFPSHFKFHITAFNKQTTFTPIDF